MRTIIFFDPMGGGHRPQHACAYIRRLAEQTEVRAIFVLRQQVIEDVRRELGRAIGPGVELRAVSETDARRVKANNKDIAGGLWALGYIEAIARQTGAEEIFLMHLDTFLPALYVKSFQPGHVRYSGLYFKPTLHYGKVFGSRLKPREALYDRLKTIFLKRVLKWRSMRLIFTLDPHFIPGFSHVAERSKLIAAPDLASPPSTRQRPPDIPDQWVSAPHRFLLFGSLAPRKGVVQLLDAIALAARDLEDSQFLICGGVEPGFEGVLPGLVEHANAQFAKPAVTLIPRFLKNEELWWLVDATEVVLAPYQRHIGFSGVLCWAAAGRRPILTQDFGVLGWETRENGLGEAVNTQDPAEIAKALVRMSAEGASSAVNTGAQAAFSERHTERSFSDAVIGPLLNDADSFLS